LTIKNSLILAVITNLVSQLAYPRMIYPFYFSIVFVTSPYCLKIYLNHHDNNIHNQFSFNHILGTFIYCYSTWLFINHSYCGIVIYILATIYLILRFAQIRDTINKNKTDAMLLYCFKDHNQICGINQRNNPFLSHFMFLLYYLLSIIIDIQIYIAIDDKNILLKTVFILISIWLFFLLFITYIFSAYLSTSAHSPYKILNTIVITRKLTYSNKFNLMNLISWLGGPDIATYVADLFPINMFQFYLLVANLAKNFFIILDTFYTK
jgi:hypothetical protein